MKLTIRTLAICKAIAAGCYHPNNKSHWLVGITDRHPDFGGGKMYLHLPDFSYNRQALDQVVHEYDCYFTERGELIADTCDPVWKERDGMNAA